MLSQSECPSDKIVSRDYLSQYVKLRRDYLEKASVLRSSKLARYYFLRDLQKLYMEHPRLRFDFLGEEKEKLLKEIRTYNTKLISRCDSPPVRE